MKNNVFLKTLLLASLVCIVGSSNAQTTSDGTCTISRTFYKNDGTPLEGVRVTVTKVVKNGRNISLGPVTYVSNASGVVSITVPQGSTVYMEIPVFNTSGGVRVNTPASSGWTYASDATKSPTGNVKIFSVNYDSLIVQRNDVTLGTKHTTIDFSTTFNATESPTAEANISINHDSLKARPGSKLTYLHNLFVDRGLSAWDETSLTNAHTKALDSNFVLIVPPDYPASTMTFSASDASLKLINYDTLNITANQTVPKGASIVMAGTGVFNISSGVTLTFASGSRFDGGLQRRFIGSGTVKFQEDVVSEVYPQWWGAVGDSSTQCVAAFQSAVNSGVKRITVKVPDGDYLFNDNLTIPSNVSLIGKGRFNISSSKTLTFASGSRFDGGMQRRFIGSGTVKFQEDVVESVYPQWWGAVGDSATQCVTAFRSAANSGVKRIRVKTPPGTYVIDDSIRIPSNVDFIGENACLVSSDTSKKVLTVGPLVKNIKISGFTIRYNARPAVRKPNTSAFFITECDTLEISHNRILFAPGMGIQIIACKTVKVQFNHVENTLADGIHITNGLNGDTGRNLWSADFIITNNTVFNVGDDHIACVSYQRPLVSDHPLCQGNPPNPGCPPWNGVQSINRNGVIANNIVKGGLTKYKCRGISVLGGQDIIIANNIVEGHPVAGDTNNTVMVSGILVQGQTSPFTFFRPNRIKVIGNTIKNSYAPHFDAEQGGIKIQGADSVEVIGNYINWSPNIAGILIRATNELVKQGYTNVARDIIVEDNTLQNPRSGVRILSTDTTGSNNGWNRRITIRNNRFSNVRLYGVSADSVNWLAIEGNIFFEVNTSNATGIAAIRINRCDNDVSIKHNSFRSSTTMQYGVLVSDTMSTSLDIRESDNIYKITTTTANVFITPDVTGTNPPKFYTQGTKRIHYDLITTSTAPTNGTWEKGDIVYRTDFTAADSGGAMGWVCVVAGTPGTWYEFGPISKSIDKEYGSLRLLADTISVGTTFTRFTTAENRPRSVETVFWNSDSSDVLKITHSGRYRISGFLNCASGSDSVAIQIGVSLSNASPPGEFITEHYFISASQFANIPFNYFIQLGPNKTIRLKFRRTSGSGNVYIKSGWLTLERLN